jgi:Flp pilus assembly protein TadG
MALWHSDLSSWKLPEPPFRRRLGGFARDSSGVTAVEFGLVAMPFFAIMCAIIETALVFFAGQLLETAVVKTSREIRTGRAQSMSWTKETFTTELCRNISAMISCSGSDPNLFVDVKTSATFAAIANPRPVDSAGKFSETPSYAPGTGSQIVVVRVYYQYPLLVNGFGLDIADLPNHKRLLAGVVAFRNEPF